MYLAMALHGMQHRTVWGNVCFDVVPSGGGSTSGSRTTSLGLATIPSIVDQDELNEFTTGRGRTNPKQETCFLRGCVRSPTAGLRFLPPPGQACFALQVPQGTPVERKTK